VGSSNGPPGWNLLALITRSVVQLGLAVETTSFSVSPVYPSIYTLRYVFWQQYLIIRVPQNNIIRL
jgi:hypothetical protein